MRIVGLLLVPSFLALPPFAGSAGALRLYATGDFAHTQSTVPYVNHWAGAFDAEIAGTVLALPLMRGGAACRLFASWRTASDGASTLPIELCLTNDQATAPQLASWLDGHGNVDPTLAIALVSGQGGDLVNGAALSARVFVRGCGSAPDFQHYGSLAAAPGMLHFVPSTDQQGNPMLEFAATAAALSGIDAEAWSTILKSCLGKSAGLPGAPADGQSTNLAATSVPPVEGPHPVPLVHLEQAEDAVGVTALTPGKQASLVARLTKARHELRRARVAKAVKQIQKFKRKTGALVRSGLLTSQQAQLLLLPAERAQEQMLGLRVQMRTRFAIGSCAPPPCGYPDEYVIYRVSNRAKRPPGSPPVDFNNIGAALDAAAALGVCGVELIIEPGTYADNQVITRDTRFTGEDRDGVVLTGSIINLEDVAMQFSRLTLRSSGAFGAVHVDSPCALTTITDVDISRSRFYGVRHDAGGLRVVDSTIANTQTALGSLRAGTGIYLTGGAQAAIENSTLEHNGAAALVAEGLATKVHVALSVIDGNLTTPHLDPTDPLGDGFAAVEVLDQALLLMEHTDVNGNELLGIYAHGDSQGHVRDSSLTRTQARAGSGGGHNFFARHTQFELTRITTANADFIGIVVASAPFGGIIEGTYVTGNGCEVLDNVIGVRIDSTPPDEDLKYHPELCIAVTNFDGNETNSEVDPLVIPCGLGQINEHCPPSACRSVAFDCTWCGEG